MSNLNRCPRQPQRLDKIVAASPDGSRGLNHVEAKKLGTCYPSSYPSLQIRLPVWSKLTRGRLAPSTPTYFLEIKNWRKSFSSVPVVVMWCAPEIGANHDARQHTQRISLLTTAGLPHKNQNLWTEKLNRRCEFNWARGPPREIVISAIVNPMPQKAVEESTPLI